MYQLFPKVISFDLEMHGKFEFEPPIYWVPARSPWKLTYLRVNADSNSLDPEFMMSLLTSTTQLHHLRFDDYGFDCDEQFKDTLAPQVKVLEIADYLVSVAEELIEACKNLKELRWDTFGTYVLPEVEYQASLTTMFIKAHKIDNWGIQLSHVTTLHFAVPYAYDHNILWDIVESFPNIADMTFSHDDLEHVSDEELQILDAMSRLRSLKLVGLEGCSGSFLVGRFRKLQYLELCMCIDVTVFNLMKFKQKCKAMQSGTIRIVPHRDSDEGAMVLV
jgi:hypothetical protein